MLNCLNANLDKSYKDQDGREEAEIMQENAE